MKVSSVWGMQRVTPSVCVVTLGTIVLFVQMLLAAEFDPGDRPGQDNDHQQHRADDNPIRGISVFQ